MQDEPKSTIKLSAKQVGELAEWIGESIEKRKRTLVSDALKRQGIEAKPDYREVNILSGKRFEEDMGGNKELRQSAENWVSNRFDYRDYQGQLTLDDAEEAYRAGYEAGYAEGYEVARRRKKEDEQNT